MFTLLSRMAPTLYKFLATGAVKTKLALLFGMGTAGAYKVKEWADARRVLNAEGMSTLELTRVFKEIDTDGSGYVDAGELQAALQKKGLSLSAEQVSVLMKSADENSDGKLSQAEWVHAMGKSR
jgi:Ca2+-binding EF-hand superfamily protein